MLDEDYLHSLPDDPDEALALLYRMLKEKLNTEHNIDIATNGETAFSLSESRRTVLNTISAFVDANSIPFEIDRDLFWTDDYAQLAFANIEHYIAKTSFQRANRLRNGTSAVYVLSADLKTKIQRYLTSVRELIANSELSDNKRSVLSKKLNAFAEEVDRDKTRIEALASAIIWAKKETIEGVQGLEPIVEKLGKTLDSFARATEWLRPSIQAPQNQLPAPQKRIEGPKRDLDDEVPF